MLQHEEMCKMWRNYVECYNMKKCVKCEEIMKVYITEVNQVTSWD